MNKNPEKVVKSKKKKGEIAKINSMAHSTRKASAPY
jgi:hypothetical protein